MVGALILGLHDDDAEVRAASANSLGSVVRGLLDGWKTSPDELRTNQPLVSTTSRALIGLLSDHNETVKTEVLRALVVIHYRVALQEQPVAGAVSVWGSTERQGLGQGLRAALATSLSDQTPEIRGLAAWVSGRPWSVPVPVTFRPSWWTP